MSRLHNPPLGFFEKGLPSARFTSSTHPIRVNFIPPELHGFPGRLGLTFAPGKKDTKWDRDLDVDLAALQALGATHLLSLMDAWEYEHLQVPRLRERAADFGMAVTWHRIPDQGVPTDTAAFLTVLVTLREALAQGSTVIVHCRGGLGRTGIAAACTLIVGGMTAAEALRSVRATRPGTVENDRQEAYLRHFEKAVRPKRRRVKATP